MSFRCLNLTVLLAAIVGALVSMPAARASDSTPRLRICADPNNLPFSNDRLEGFENRLADLLARDLGARVEYTWWAQRRGYVRNTLTAGLCDVWMGVPAASDRTLVTRPYYRSSYVFVTRREDPIVAGLDDPALHRVRVGVQLVGDDGQNTPPAHALAARHIVRNVVGYTLYGDYARPNPPRDVVDAVARGDVDVAVVWGPVAGFFAHASPRPLVLTPVTPQVDDSLPFAFDISIGVARRVPALRDRIDGVLARRGPEVARVLDAYHIPRADQ